ncbi:MAG: hypothetical protein H6695_15455 [Deferribacteres bacterium]|nr:hypothetical protein [Deferribacteres bacterium]
MNRMSFISGIIFVVLAVMVFLLADGLRRWYSGILFALIGAVLLVNAMRQGRVPDQQNQSGK